MDKTSFPQRLTEERKQRGCTQKQVAEALGVSDRTYSKWETGENEMDVSTLCRLGEFYGESPALFFREEGGGSTAVRSELAALPVKEAAKGWFRVHYEAMMGMFDSFLAEAKRDYTVYQRPVPLAEVPENPSEHRDKAPATLTAFRSPNLMALMAAGDDLNLSLLLEPNRENYAWLRAEAAELSALFRVLGMPGALPCLSFLMSQPSSELFTLSCLAQKAGVTEEEAAAFLEVVGPLGLCVSRRPLLRHGREENLYQGHCREELVGILSLAKLLIRDEASLRRYGHLGGTNAMIPEKGGEEA